MVGSYRLIVQWFQLVENFSQLRSRREYWRDFRCIGYDVDNLAMGGAISLQ